MRCFRRSLFLLAPLLASAALASPAEAESYFQEVPSPFGNQPCGGQGCYTNYLVVVDIDNDGKLDVLIPNALGTSDGDQPFVVYKNKGDATFTDVSAQAVNGFAGALRQVAVADVTGDGFVDIYAPNAQGHPDKFFINDGTGKFVDEAAARLPGVSSHAAAVRFADIDNDGDLDLFVGDSLKGNGGPVAHLYLNDGSGKFSESPSSLPASAGGTQPFDFDLLDADGDFDLDLFVDMHSGKGLLWLNDGAGKMTDATANLPAQSGLKYNPAACDVDGDGDLDVWQDNSGPGYTEQLMINDGTGKFSDETAARVSGNPGSDDNGLACIDADGDGDFDAAVIALGTAERLLKNDGTGHFLLDLDAFPGPADSSLWADFGDLNGDGKLDVVTGQGESGNYLNRVYIGSGAAVVDTVAPKIRAVEAVATPTSDDAPVVRFGVSDNATTDVGPRLQKAYLKITAPQASEASAMFLGGDLFRAVLPAQAGGTEVSFQACAVDRRGNEGCSTTYSYTVSGMGPATTGSGAGGTGGNGGMGGSDHGGNGNGAGGNETGGSNGGGENASSGSGDNGNGGSGFDLEEGGCGCTVPGSGAPGPGAVTLAVAAALGALARRRRSHARGR